MESLEPIVFVRSFNTVGEALILWRSNWRRLRLVMIGLFLLNLALTVAMVNLASQHVNLDSVRPFFEIAVNSTTTRVGAVAVPNEGTEASLSWKPRFITHVDLGEFFTVLSIIAAIIFISYTCNCNLPARRVRWGKWKKVIRKQKKRTGGSTSRGQHPAGFTTLSSWREWKSLCILLINGMAMFIFISAVVDELELEKYKSRYLEHFLEFLCLLTIVVASKERLHAFSAAEKACVLAGKKFYGIVVLGTMTFVAEDFLDDIYLDGVYLYRKEQEETPVIREDTATEIFLFSIAAALLTLVLQVFQCLVILALYSDGRLPKRDGNDVTGVPATQPLREAEAARAGSASGASSSAGGSSLNPNTTTARRRRNTRAQSK